MTNSAAEMKREHAMRTGKVKGFTLIEMMIVVAIIAILAAIAYPSYTKYVYRVRRSDGQKFLMAIAAAEERYYTNFNKYTTSIVGTSSDGLGFPSATSEGGYYSVAITFGSTNDIKTSFKATATPIAPQDGDTSCPTLAIDNALSKTPLPGQQANGSCW
jgi:type IV pilus assembly protein PilE